MTRVRKTRHANEGMDVVTCLTYWPLCAGRVLAPSVSGTEATLRHVRAGRVAALGPKAKNHIV